MSTRGSAGRAWVADSARAVATTRRRRGGRRGCISADSTRSDHGLSSQGLCFTGGGGQMRPESLLRKLSPPISSLALLLSYFAPLGVAQFPPFRVGAGIP